VIVDRFGAYSETEWAGRFGAAVNALRGRGIGAGSTVLIVVSNRSEAVVV
jgi:hypothetical protein